MVDLRDEINLELRGARVGMIGFARPEADQLANILEPAGSACRPFRIRDEVVGWEACDVLLVSADATGLIELLTNLVTTRLPWLLVGARENILSNSILHLRADETIFTPYPADELLFRVHRAFRRRAVALPAPPDPRVATVLIADDDPAVVSLLKSVLQGCGLKCHVAKDGREAVLKTRELLPDLLLLDINMPLMNGLDVLRCVKRDAGTKNVKVLLLTACREAEKVDAGSTLGADGYLVKPFNHLILSRRIKAILAGNADVSPVSSQVS